MTSDSDLANLRVRLTARLISKDITFTQYKKLCEWLGCYAYIIPASRVLIPAYKTFTIDDSSELYVIAGLLNHITVALTAHEQELLWTILHWQYKQQTQE